MFLKRTISIHIAGLLLICSLGLQAQFPNPVDFNTATNATNTGTIPVGSNDLHWTASITGIAGAYLPAVSVGSLAPGSWAVSPYANCNWITYPHNCIPNNWPIHSCNGNVDVFYKLTFNLPNTNCGGTAVSTPSAYCLTFDYFSDNWVSNIYVNGLLSYTNFTATPYSSWGFLTSNAKTVSLCNNWLPGANTVIVHTQSGPAWEGFLAQANQTITPSSNLTANITVTNAPCFNGVGSSSVTAGGIAGPYTYTWLPSGGNASSATNLTAGNYTVIVATGACVISKTLTITQPAAVVLNVSPSNTLCQGATTLFTVSGANTYTWSTGATGTNITASVTGVYTVTGANVNGCTTTATVGLTVNPTPTLSVSGNTLICGTGQSTTLTANGANTYTWLPGNTNNSIEVLSPPVNTTYTVTGNNTYGCSNTTTINVVMNNFTLTVGPQLSICNGQSATLTANGTTSYTWMPGNFIGQNYVVSPSSSQNYTVMGNIGPCDFTATQNVIVTPVPTVNINMIAPQAICVGVPVTLNASGANSYLWQPGNFNSSSIVVTPSVSLTYTVTGNNGNCSNQATQLVLVEPPLNVNIAVSSATICKGDVGVVTANGSSSYIYSWEPGGGLGNTYTVQPNQNTTYIVTASNGTCSATASVNVIVSTVIADFSDNSVNSNYFELVEFTNSSVNNISNYWYFSNNVTSTETHPKINFEKEGTYVACLLVKNQRGCSDTLCKVINIGCPEDALFIPNTFTPNDDGLNDVFRVSSVANCLESFEMDIFDRWGEKIFNSKKLEKGWDGKIKGVIAKDDTYAYLVKYTMTNKKSYSKTGHVVLIK